MPPRLAAHLHRNRHDTFYFRQAVPPDLAPFFATKEIYKTLATRDRLEARHRALVIAAQVQTLFSQLRRIPKKKPSHLLQTNLTVTLDFDVLKGFTQAKVQAEPHEEEMAHRLVPELLRAAQDKLRGQPSKSGTASKRLSELIERYCQEQTHWKPQSRDDIRGDLRQIAAVAVDPLSADLTRPMLSQVQSVLLKLPSNLNKLPAFAGKSYDEIIALGHPARPNRHRRCARSGSDSSPS